MDFSTEQLWAFLPRGYLLTITIEIPILLIGLSSCHSFRRRVVAGFWLTACTYPVVILVLPLTVGVWWGRLAYLVTAEIFAPIAECLLFRVAFPIPVRRGNAVRDMAAITAANLGSFVFGYWMYE